MACQVAIKLFSAFILLKLGEVFGLPMRTMRLSGVGSDIDTQYIRMAFLMLLQTLCCSIAVELLNKEETSYGGCSHICC